MAQACVRWAPGEAWLRHVSGGLQVKHGSGMGQVGSR